MTLRFDERPNSRRTSLNPLAYETQYVATGSGDQGIIRAYAANTTPALVALADGILFRDDIQVQEQGYNVHWVTVRYVTQDQQKPPTGSVKFAFSTTGGTFHITHSKETVNSYLAGGGTPPSYEQAINARKAEGSSGWEIEGADIIIPALKMTYTITHPLGFLNENHARNLARLTAGVNDSAWRGFAAGEVLFLGADGSDGSNAEAECAYHFACESNLEDLVYGTITGVEKDGHDLLWVETKKDVTSTKPVVKVLAVRVERVYRRINFAAAFGF